jgi:FHA domain
MSGTTVGGEPGLSGGIMKEREEAAVLFADVSRSTRAYEKAGDAIALAGIGSCVNLLKRISTDYGRDPAADLVIRDKMASRTRGKIERRLEKYALIDHGVNGTFVKNDGEREIILRREEFILHGQGSIGFGQSCEKTTEVVRFKCT